MPRDDSEDLDDSLLLPAHLALEVVALFAVAQDALSLAFQRHLEDRLTADVAKFVRGRVRRLSDDELRDMAVAVARAEGFRLHPVAFSTTYSAVKRLRDRIAHGGYSLPIRDDSTNEPGLVWFGGDELHTVPRSELDRAVRDALWLADVAQGLSGARGPGGRPWRTVADAPHSSFVDWANSLDGFGQRPDCPGSGHQDVNAAETVYGKAWICNSCTWLGLVELTPRG